MSLFGDMFEEEPGQVDTGASGANDSASNGPSPPSPRLASNLCGITNQGATCYMNALLQTMVMTPEFRQALLALTSKELGELNSPQHFKKARVIPLQLQRLFARLMLLSVQSCSTTDLTDSFGWTNNEELQQHDAQELNRILFSAIEDSLIGTSGHNLISDLYGGIIVNQTECGVCGRVSEREETFRDVCVAVSDTSSLEESLCQSYINTELLTGDNQYRCERCRKLVNATKGAKLRKLPPILTFSLLRFSFDYKKMERFKEIGKFSFPTRIDMAPFCEGNLAASNTEYELYSVVIHSGSTHGGHYRAYIRDVDQLGKWTHPDEESIQVAIDPATGQVDFMEYDTAVELVQAILARGPKEGYTINKLCAVLMKETGVSWNKRFKHRYGPMTKFLRKYDDKFVYDPATTSVTLKSHSAPSQELTGVTDTDQKTRPFTPPAPGHCWFDYNDGRVSPVLESAMEKQFSGKESAYMLFYRSATLSRPETAFQNPAFGISDHLLQVVQEENIKVDQERHDFELRVNTWTFQLHFSLLYTVSCGILQPRDDSCSFLQLSIDRRKTIQDLVDSILEVGDEVICMASFSTSPGLWQEYAIVLANKCFPMAKGMTFEEAAAIPVNYITAYHMLFELGNLRPGNKVLVHMAAGGVGVAATQLCHTLPDVTVFGTASAAKHDVIKKGGVNYTIDYHTQDYAEEIKKISPEGVDIVLDPLSGSDSGKSYDLLKPFGKIIHFGAANVMAGKTKSWWSMIWTYMGLRSFNPLKMITENKAIAGYHLGYLTKHPELVRSAALTLVDLYKQEKIKPVIDSVWAFEDFDKAMSQMEERRNIGKVILSPQKEPVKR